LAGPTIPWRRVLASAVRRAIAHAAGCHDYAYRRPDRPPRARLVVAIIGDPAVAEHVPAWATTVLVPAS
jgi:hypothetical protein